MGLSLRICVIILFFSYNSFAQKDNAEIIDLFSQSLSKSNESLHLNKTEKTKIYNANRSNISIPININGSKRMLNLRRQELLSKNYKLLNSKNDPIHSSKPLFYLGEVENSNNSKVSFIISPSSISLSMIVEGKSLKLQNEENGKLTLAKTPQRPLRKQPKCGTSHYEKLPPLSKSFSKSMQNDDEGILVYFEADYALYLKENQSIENTESYIHDVFNQVAMIYANEDIDIRISSIKVWDTPEPYDLSSSQNGLTSFRSALSGNFDGHIAHLISGNSADHGGKAYIDALCDKSRGYAYSNVHGDYSGLSNFHWDPFIIAHEMGHNFGSRHTHDCVWGPNKNRVLDFCGNQNPPCTLLGNQPTPGTIMSYCHLSSGVEFDQGFGIEPGVLIKSKYDACLSNTGISCVTAIPITTNGKFTALGPIHGRGASQRNADHANWYKFIAPSDGRIKIFNCTSGVDSRLWVHSGDCDNLILIAQSDDTCGPVGQYEFSSSIPQLEVNAEEVIYIEWDDRWSGDGFDFYFKFGSGNL